VRGQVSASECVGVSVSESERERREKRERERALFGTTQSVE
jgi:hypothetical protein